MFADSLGYEILTTQVTRKTQNPKITFKHE